MAYKNLLQISDQSFCKDHTILHKSPRQPVCFQLISPQLRNQPEIIYFEVKGNLLDINIFLFEPELKPLTFVTEKWPSSKKCPPPVATNFWKSKRKKWKQISPSNFSVKTVNGFLPNFTEKAMCFW